MRLLLAATLLLLPAAARAEGMPQLDFANPLTTSQVVWGVIIFAVLYILASRFALPQVSDVLEERAAHIAADLESAQSAKNRSDSAIEDVNAATAKARADAQAAISKALDEAKQAAAQQAVVLNERLEQQLQQAETRIAAARTAAMGALRDVATETASNVVVRLTGAPVNRARLDTAVASAMAARAGSAT
jgi:F-type H+-transporting ATPase subunit b